MTIHTKAGGVEFRNVTRRYGAVTAVNNVSFTADPGTLVTLLGPSGCGKTTTLRMIAGLETVSGGQVFIGGKDVTLLHATDRSVAMVFQSYALFPHMTVLQNVAFGLEMSGMSRQDREDKASEGLRVVGLAGYEKRLPSELSGGQQQRVAVARALVLEPEVLLFDEPLSNLDAKLRRRMRDDIRDLQQSLGLTSVYVTHDQEEALAVSDKIIVMNRAVIAQEGSPRDLYERPADRFVADFIGGANLVEGRILSRDSGKAKVDIGGVEILVPDRPLDAEDVLVAIRPNAITLDTSDEAAGLRVKVRKTVYLGSHIEYALESDLGEFFAIDHNVAAAVKPGTSAVARFIDRGTAMVSR
ncbi:ABC transporter ATP-binding protein [Stappia sp. F7233]|uniref:ABC transporter ATP-binding protein n=1 Tax=Stappia albiluteola TaxID=2758565 RepID=A0A839AAR9_9HYPH|nr:ABC transporter ATP-binding protein [Stappia albiluteola]MBA5776042.1 ABC transporter ATP-binding protein [Stappia albiluteola]